MRRSLILWSARAAVVLGFPVWAAPPRQTVQVVTTDRVDLGPGGTVRLTHSSGDLNMEAWDQPAVEITVTRTAFRHDTPQEQEQAKRDLDRIQVSAKRLNNGDVDVATDFPSRNRLVRALRGFGDFNLDYRIKVPRDAKLVIRHEVGDVTVEGVAGDIDARDRAGDIVLQLPGSARYAVDAKCTVGNVYSDWEGTNRGSNLVGQRFIKTGDASAHHVFLRVGIGGITIQRQ